MGQALFGVMSLLWEKKEEKSIAQEIAERAREKQGLYVVAIAGETGSGKSYNARKLAEELKKLGLDVEVLEADMFYIDETAEKAERLGTYDHPSLIGCWGSEVREAVERAKLGFELEIPEYSFVTGRRTGRKLRKRAPKDVLIVEGLYAINFLPDADFKLYVEAWSRAELIVRRLVRDIERAKLKPEQSMEIMAPAAAMYRVFGRRQKEEADRVLISDYRVLEDVGELSYQAKVSMDGLELEGLELAGVEEIEDVYYSDGSSLLRIRLVNGSELRLAMRSKKYLKNDVYIVKSWEYSTKEKRVYAVAHTLAQLYGLKPIKIVRKLRQIYRFKGVNAELRIDHRSSGVEAEIFAKSEAALLRALKKYGLKSVAHKYAAPF